MEATKKTKTNFQEFHKNKEMRGQQNIEGNNWIYVEENRNKIKEESNRETETQELTRFADHQAIATIAKNISREVEQTQDYKIEYRSIWAT